MRLAGFGFGLGDQVIDRRRDELPNDGCGDEHDYEWNQFIQGREVFFHVLSGVGLTAMGSRRQTLCLLRGGVRQEQPAGDTGPSCRQNAEALLAGTFSQVREHHHAHLCSSVPGAGCRVSSVRTNRAMRKILFNQDSSGGGGGTVSGQITEPTTPVATSPAVVIGHTAMTPAATPPAARTVIEGDVTEETLRLRETVGAKDVEIEALKKQLKLHEITVCEYQDKLHALTSPQNVPIKRASEPKRRRFGFMR